MHRFGFIIDFLYFLLILCQCNSIKLTFLSQCGIFSVQRHFPITLSYFPSPLVVLLLSFFHLLFNSLSIFPIHFWFGIGLSKSCTNRFLQNSLNLLLRKIVAGSVFVTCGIHCLPMSFCNTKRRASGHSDISESFFAFIALWNGAAIPIAISWSMA